MPILKETIQTGISNSTRDNLEKIMVTLNNESVNDMVKFTISFKKHLKQLKTLFNQTQKVARSFL